MNYEKAKRLAAEILKVGLTKIWVSPDARQRIKESMTKDDVRALIKEKLITKRKEQGHSRGSARILKIKKEKGRKRGKGKRTGTKKARKGNKEHWMKNVRAQRKMLKELKKSGAKLKEDPRKIYLKIKGNFFKGKKQLLAMVEEGKK